jgi:hypothetical protein
MGDRRPLLHGGGLFMGEESEEDEDRDGSLRGLPLQGRIAPRFALPRS